MKKFGKVSILLVAAMSMALMGGCGKKNDETTAEATTAAVSTTSDATTTEEKKEFVFKEEDATAMIDKFSGFCELGDYKGLEYNAQNTVVSDDMVKERVDTLRNTFATTKEVTEGEAKSGDTVNIDYVGSVDGVPFDGGSTNGSGYDLLLGSGRFIPGFEDQVIGHKVGENFDITVTFPDPYQSADLAGKEAVFNITINYIVVTELPELTDSFIASYTDATSVKEYEDKAKKDLEEKWKSEDEYVNKNTVLDLALSNAKVDTYPTDEIDKLVNRVIDELDIEAQGNQMTLDDYVVNAIGMSSVDELKTYLSGQAKDYLKQQIFVCAVAKAENITISQEEFNEIVDKIILNNAIDRATLEQTYSIDEVIYFAISEKVNDFILKNAVPAK